MENVQTLYAWRPPKQDDNSYGIYADSLEEAKVAMWDYLTNNNLIGKYENIDAWIVDHHLSIDQEQEVEEPFYILVG